jgi:ABC-type sugar transport system ATPase subunit
MTPFLEIKNISKSFGATDALKDVSFSFFAGEVIALVGENGAGKSTLMKILSGAIKKDKGDIFLENKEIEINNTRDAIQYGISTVYQELSLCPNLSIAENIFVNREPSKAGIINKTLLNKKCKELLIELEFELKPNILVKELSLAQKQMVEIIKAISVKAKLLILDEPTSALEKVEVEKLFKLIEKMKEQNTSIVFISHKLDEVFHISDRVVVLRDGMLINTIDTKKTTQSEVIKLMVGRSINQLYPDKSASKGEEILKISNFTSAGKFHDISLSLHKGEVLGFAGLSGAGRTEVMQAFFGYENKDSGEISIEGKNIVINNPREALNNGIAYSPEDRKEKGLFLSQSVEDNISAASLYKYSKKFLLDKKLQGSLSDKFIEKLSIKTKNRKSEVNSLSGGNQQKVLLSKYLATEPKIFVVDEPTRGIDVGSKVEIHKLLRDFANNAGAVILISSDLMEIVGLSDRVLIFHDGRIKGELCKNITEQNIMDIIFNN